MKVDELRNLSSEELLQKVGSLKRELLDLRMQASAGKLEKTHQSVFIRKDLARVLTLLKEKKEQPPSKESRV